MPKGFAEVKVTGRLFEAGMTARVVGILDRHLEEIGQQWPAEVGKRLKRNKGLDTGALLRALPPAKLGGKHLIAQGYLRDSRVESYYHRVEYGTPAYGTRGQNQRANARRALLRQLSPQKIGAVIAAELNG